MNNFIKLNLSLSNVWDGSGTLKKGKRDILGDGKFSRIPIFGNGPEF